jgi:mannose-6-phosphate isomerase-like protein (cupin superfamily)
MKGLALAVGLLCIAGTASAQDHPEFRRVVTGLSEDGRSIVVSDGAPEVIQFDAIPGYVLAPMWRTGPGARLPGPGETPSAPEGSLIPGPGGTHLLLLRWPSGAELSALAEKNPDLETDFMSELADRVPDLAASILERNPALHATTSIDYVVVLSGTVIMELDDGATVELGPGDVVVQNGTAHAWHSPGEDGAVMAAVLVGTPNPAAAGEAGPGPGR